MPARRRRSIRLPGYPYTAGTYFVTICTHEQARLFGEVVGDVVMLTKAGRIAARHWHRLPRLFEHVALDAFVVMPNHLHGILLFHEGTRRGEAFAATSNEMPRAGAGTPSMLAPHSVANASPLPGGIPPGGIPPGGIPPGGIPPDGGPPDAGPRGTTPGSLGAVVQNYKSVTTRRINRMRGTPGGKVWQRNYWERVLRGERELWLARRYVEENPLRWHLDRYGPRGPG